MYIYETEKPGLFTEIGQVTFLTIRDKTKELIKTAGSARAQEMMNAAKSGNTWLFLACIDRMVELGEIREITNPEKVVAQHRVFVSVNNDA